MNYPMCHFRKHPVLVLLVLINYWLREHGLARDEWYWADLKLFGMRQS